MYKAYLFIGRNTSYSLEISRSFWKGLQKWWLYLAYALVFLYSLVYQPVRWSSELLEERKNTAHSGLLRLVSGFEALWRGAFVKRVYQVRFFLRLTCSLTFGILLRWMLNDVKSPQVHTSNSCTWWSYLLSEIPWSLPFLIALVNGIQEALYIRGMPKTHQIALHSYLGTTGHVSFSLLSVFSFTCRNKRYSYCLTLHLSKHFSFITVIQWI